MVRNARDAYDVPCGEDAFCIQTGTSRYIYNHFNDIHLRQREQTMSCKKPAAPSWASHRVCSSHSGDHKGDTA